MSTLPESKIFTPIQAGALALRNRVVMAPLTRNRAPGAMPNDLMQTYYVQRASAGLIITEATAISHQGQGYADVPGIWSPTQVLAWRKITDAVHAAGGKIVVQLWHVGRVSHCELQPKGGAPVAPSALQANAKTVLMRQGVATFVETSMPRALELTELPGIVADYRTAARNAVAAGFDGAEVHAANGYLLDQFLKSGANQRSDAYGGSIENRARLLMEVMHAVVAEIGADRTAIRLSPVTPSNGIDEPQPQPLFDYVARQLGQLGGLAYLHLIEGTTGGAREVEGRAFDYVAFQQAYRDAGGTAAWMVNNAYDGALAQAALSAAPPALQVDLVAFGRPFIANPDLVERLRRGCALNAAQRQTFYGGGAAGYTDYPSLS
jgi:N-ethylmaleimide reductase